VHRTTHCAVTMKDRLQCIAMHCTVFAQKHSLQEPATSDLTRALPQMQQSSPSSGFRQPALFIQEAVTPGVRGLRR
jgi:hypothetical protein